MSRPMAFWVFGVSLKSICKIYVPDGPVDFGDAIGGWIGGVSTAFNTDKFNRFFVG
jgi:hypothetical protein